MKSGEFDDLSITTAFLLPHSCWIGNYMANRYLAGALLFSKKSEVLTLIAATVPVRIWLRNLFIYPFLKGKNFGDSYLSYLKSSSWNHDFNSPIIKYDERARVILGDGTLKRQRFILKQDQSELEKNVLRSKQLRKIITPSFVIPIVDALRFYPDQSKIYWDKCYIDEYLNYRLEKAKDDGSSYVVYEGTNTMAIDNNINNGEKYYLSYVWSDSNNERTTSDNVEAIVGEKYPSITYNLTENGFNLTQYIIKHREKQENEIALINATAKTDPISILASAIEHNQTDIVNLLLKAGADPNMRYENRYPLIASAIYHNRLNIVALLLNSGGNPNIQFNDGSPIIVFAIDHHKSEIVPLLLDTGADPNGKDANGWTPLKLAINTNSLDINNSWCRSKYC